MSRKHGWPLSRVNLEMTDSIVVRAEAGNTLDKARQLEVKVLSEEEFLEMMEGS